MVPNFLVKLFIIFELLRPSSYLRNIVQILDYDLRLVASVRLVTSFKTRQTTTNGQFLEKFT